MISNQNDSVPELLEWGNFSQIDLKNLQCYHDLLTSDFKKSLRAYQKFEPDRIPRWNIQRSLQKVPGQQEVLQKHYSERFLSQLDRRYPVVLALDDFVVKRYGHSAFATEYFYSNAHGGITWGNQLVDVTLKNGLLVCPVSYEIHEKQEELKLWERGQRQIEEVRQKLLAANVREKRIWVVADTTYANRVFQEYLIASQIFYLLGLPKSRKVELFGRTGQVAEFLHSCPERQITIDKRLYTYKQTIINVQGWDRRQIIAIYRGHGVWKYYVSNNLRSTIFTLLKRLKDR